MSQHQRPIPAELSGSQNRVAHSHALGYAVLCVGAKAPSGTKDQPPPLASLLPGTLCSQAASQAASRALFGDAALWHHR